MATVGASELCTCGSGKKYKKCCRDKDAAKNPRSTPTPEQLSGIAQVVRKAQRDQEKSKYQAPEYHEIELGGRSSESSVVAYIRSSTRVS
jgi:hypothetical protein